MKKEKKYIDYILKQAEALLAIDSPSDCQHDCRWYSR